jgi:hypothetical protein
MGIKVFSRSTQIFAKRQNNNKIAVKNSKNAK